MEYRTPWDPAPVVTPVQQAPPSPLKRRGRRPATQAVPVEADAAWLYHHLTISGPAEGVASFAEAARGAGIVPWRLDGARIEEDLFHLAASQPRPVRSLTVEGCRILARQFRERVEDRAAQAAARVERSRACPGGASPGGACPGGACPFDLHTLLPVPAAILALGPTHPGAEAWLATHWGVTDSPRQVAERSGATAGRRLPGGHRVIGYSFFTAGETPHSAIAALGQRWPALRFMLQPRPAD